MPRKKVNPISDDELAGLIMAVTAEAGRAGYDVRFKIHDNGSLVLQFGHASKRFIMQALNNGRFERLAISDTVSVANVTAVQPEPEEFHYKTEPVTAGGES